jgi:hypothetical protein
VVPSILDTELEPSLATYIVFVLGLTPTAKGNSPTGIVATTALVAPFITETVLAPELVTYIVFVDRLTPTPLGLFPTGTVLKQGAERIAPQGLNQLHSTHQRSVRRYTLNTLFSSAIAIEIS